MTVKIGYLLPTREGVMEGRHAARPVVDIACAAEAAGLDSVWLGDSVTGKPRHDPLTMMAAIAARTEHVAIGTAVLLPILRNPVVLAQQLATIDQLSEGRLIAGIGIGQDIPAVHAEFDAVGVPFEKRVGRMMEGIRLWKALWTGQPVTHAGRWQLRDITIGPQPYRAGGPPIWASGSVPAALARCAKHFDGWFPSGPSDASVWTRQFSELRDHAIAAGRPPNAVTGAAYLTLAINDDDTARADAALNSYLERYYQGPAAAIRKYQGSYAGNYEGAVAWLKGYVDGGATHICLRLIGDHDQNVPVAARIKAALN
jgi:alkanesulfonate monooxygenase SsuD/methylene tetrahydromethanopterin reductase-like flavin-dependent oxidoreductase (luciferase family)